MNNLLVKLNKLNNQSYGAYKSIKGVYKYDYFNLSIDHVQGDPFAAPSRISIYIDKDATGFGDNCWSNPIRQTAFEDLIARGIKSACTKLVKGYRGSGKSGEISIACNGQQVLKRNAVQILAHDIEARLTLGLPANGRRIAANDAIQMFEQELPAIVEQALLAKNNEVTTLQNHLNSIEDQAYLRSWVVKNGFVAFVGNGSVLPRLSGVDDRPLIKNPVVFNSPASLEVQIELPHAGLVKGMAIPRGITLIVGGGFHGKSTLLNALELGVYDHIPGDGREQVVTDQGAVKIRAEDGRAINNVDISCFIDHLPLKKDTRHFNSENASGSTSQSANIVEAITAGSRLLLIDEDTSATNFMIRDARMQALVADDKEPITPLIFRIQDLFAHHGVSCIIVMGGSGDYFSVADRVIMLDEYLVKDVTDKAKAIADTQIPMHSTIKVNSFIQQLPRKPDKQLLKGNRGKNEFKFDVRNIKELRYGESLIDLSAVEQLVDNGQTQAIAWIMQAYLKDAYEGTDEVVQGVEAIFEKISEKGLDCLPDYKIGSLAMPRKYEVLAAINRLRGNSSQ